MLKRKVELDAIRVASAVVGGVDLARYEKARKANASDKGRGHSNRMSLDELSDVVDAAYESQFATPKQSAMRLTHER